jgi:hypothetical protein
MIRMLKFQEKEVFIEVEAVNIENKLQVSFGVPDWICALQLEKEDVETLIKWLKGEIIKFD